MKKIKLGKEGLQEFAIYINICLASDLQAESRSFIELLKHHLQEIKQKLHHKALDFAYKQRKQILIRFTHAEIITLSYAFKRIETSSFLKGIEYTLLAGL